MDASGSAHEGWMMFIPLTVLVLIVVYVLGGPVQFVNTVSGWAVDFTAMVVSFLRNV